MAISLSKKFEISSFILDLFKRTPDSVAGVDIGLHSTKVVELEYKGEIAILKAYGELLSEQYLKGGDAGAGFLRYKDSEVAALIRDLLRESDVSTKEINFSVPASSSFITTITIPTISKGEVAQAIPYEARKYVPIPLSEVMLDWEILPSEKGREENIDIILVAVPKEVVDKFKRVAEMAGAKFRSLEVETFSLSRALVGNDTTPTVILNIGHITTTLAIVDKGKVRLSSYFAHGSMELTRAIERGLELTRSRAETVKKEVGLSGKIEEREIASVMTPILGLLLEEVERVISLYNRHASRKVQKIVTAGGGSNLKGITDYLSTKFKMEVIRGNPFMRVQTPSFLQPILREMGPSFSVSTGLALRELTAR